MILFNKFGYALRHQLNFNSKTKRGSLLLWSYHDGSGMGTDPLINGKDSISEFIAHQFAVRGALFGANYYAELPLGNEKDILSLLTALVFVKNGHEYSFSNFEDRLVSFSIYKNDKQEEVIVVKIRYTNNTGKLILDEVSELQYLIRDILVDFGYSKQEIDKKMKETL